MRSHPSCPRRGIRFAMPDIEPKYEGAACRRVAALLHDSGFYQKRYFNANCRILGSLAVVI
jgi:hypothetical protein